MKYLVVIEETNTKEFKVEASSPENAQKLAVEKYYNGEFVLDPGECQFRRMSVSAPNEEGSEWVEF